MPITGISDRFQNTCWLITRGGFRDREIESGVEKQSVAPRRCFFITQRSRRATVRHHHLAPLSSCNWEVQHKSSESLNIPSAEICWVGGQRAINKTRISSVISMPPLVSALMCWEYFIIVRQNRSMSIVQIEWPHLLQLLWCNAHLHAHNPFPLTTPPRSHHYWGVLVLMGQYWVSSSLTVDDGSDRLLFCRDNLRCIAVTRLGSVLCGMRTKRQTTSGAWK